MARRQVLLSLTPETADQLAAEANRLLVGRSWLADRLLSEGLADLAGRDIQLTLPAPWDKREEAVEDRPDPATCDLICGTKTQKCLCALGADDETKAVARARREEKTAARNALIVERFLAGETPTAISRDLGIDRGHARWVLRQAGHDTREAWRARLEARRATAPSKQERDRAARKAGQAERAAERLAAGKTCRLCGGPNGRPQQTCSTRCADAWKVLRFWLDPAVYHNHRLTRAKTILRNPGRRRPGEVDWARRLLAGEDVPPNRYFVVPGSRAERVAAEFGIDLQAIITARKNARPRSSGPATMGA